jgi:hypothetical protein
VTSRFNGRAGALPLLHSGSGKSETLLEGVSELEIFGLEAMVAELGEVVREHCADGDQGAVRI